MNSPLLSVVVPVYNTEPYLRRCLDSIANQSYKNLEIILVDDGSSDNSGVICDEYGSKDSRFSIIHKNNGGNVSARKAGLEIARGLYATYVDSDDFIEYEMYESFMNLALENNADVVGGGKKRDYGTHVVLEPEQFSPGFYQGHELNKLLSNIVDSKRFFKYNISCHITDKIYKTDILKRHQQSFPDEVIIGEDFVMLCLLLYDAKSLYVSGKNYYHYCIRSDSVMGTIISEKDDPCHQTLACLHDKIKYSNDKFRNIFSQQFYYYSIYLSLLRDTFSILKYENGYLWPFGKIKKTDSIVLYGAGKFGIALHSYLDNNKFNLIAWVDKTVTHTGITSWENVKNLEFDKIIIATLIYETIKDIRLMLEQNGIAREKIYYVSMMNIQKEKYTF